MTKWPGALESGCTLKGLEFSDVGKNELAAYDDPICQVVVVEYVLMFSLKLGENETQLTSIFLRRVIKTTHYSIKSCSPATGCWGKNMIK